MRLTLAWLCVCLAIYCNGGLTSQRPSNVVLSLPPSLIAATEAVALRQLQQQQQQPEEQPQPTRWKKDARILFDSGNDPLHDMAHSKQRIAATGKYNLPYNDDNNSDRDSDSDSDMDVDVEVEQPQPADFNRKSQNEAYDLAAREQSAAQEIARQQHGHRLGPKYAATPTTHKYWTAQCQSINGNCPTEHNRAMLAIRNREALARLRQRLTDMQDTTVDDSTDLNLANANEDLNSNNEVFMLLTGEQDLVKFLHWAMQLLYPHHNLNANFSSNGADHYHPAMFFWKKLNFSGNLEPPLIVDEPHYILVRREQQQQNKQDGYQLGDDLKPEDDPFIPPRGRKHTSPDLSTLLNRYETFMPNRGKRDKVQDMFKNEDLFFPNRGKKQRNILPLDDPFFPLRGKKLQLRDLYNADDPFFPNRGKRQLTLPPASNWAQMQRKLFAGNGNNNGYGKGDNWPLGMSTHEINGNDQSVKSSMSEAAAAAAAADADAAAEGARRPRLDTGWLRLSANRLHSTRSANLQQPTSLERLIVNPGMRQQVKTSWPAGRLLRLERSVDDARETQLTRGLNAPPGHGHGHDTDTDIDIDYGQLDM